MLLGFGLITLNGYSFVIVASLAKSGVGSGLNGHPLPTERLVPASQAAAPFVQVEMVGANLELLSFS